jgi:hypothetical protein
LANDSGKLGFTLGPPTFSTSRPLTASAWSRIISAERRRRGPREFRRFSGSFSSFSGSTADAWR